MLDSDTDPNASDPPQVPNRFESLVDPFMQPQIRRARWIAMLPLVLVFGVCVYVLINEGFRSQYLLYSVMEAGVPVSIIGVLLFRRQRRWHVLGQGMYLSLALLSGVIAAIRVLGQLQHYAEQAPSFWMVYNYGLVVGYGIGSVVIWRAAVRELGQIATEKSAAFDPAAPWTQPVGPAFDAAMKVQRLRLLRLRLWALAAPFCYLVLLQGLQLLGNTRLLTWDFLLPMAIQTLILTGCWVGIFSRRPGWRVLAAGACVQLSIGLGFQLGRDWNAGTGWLFDAALGWALNSYSYNELARFLFYVQMATVALVSFWMALRLQKQELDILPGQAAAIAHAAADAREDDMDDDTSWDQSAPR